MIHHERERSAFSDRESILPHETSSTGRPSPIKLSVDSATIAFLTFITAINRTEGKKLGAKCRNST